jgi:hypothetical protein
MGRERYESFFNSVASRCSSILSNNTTLNPVDARYQAKLTKTDLFTQLIGAGLISSDKDSWRRTYFVTEAKDGNVTRLVLGSVLGKAEKKDDAITNKTAATDIQKDVNEANAKIDMVLRAFVI